MDDVIVATQRILKYKGIVHHLSKGMGIKDLGNATYYLVVETGKEIHKEL